MNPHLLVCGCFGNLLIKEGWDVYIHVVREEYAAEKRDYMPTILRIGPYRLFFYASDREEPIHVHVERGECLAKFWVDPVRLQKSIGFRRSEISRIAKIVYQYQGEIKEAWNEYFGN